MYHLPGPPSHTEGSARTLSNDLISLHLSTVDSTHARGWPWKEPCLLLGINLIEAEASDGLRWELAYPSTVTGEELLWLDRLEKSAGGLARFEDLPRAAEARGEEVVRAEELGGGT